MESTRISVTTAVARGLRRRCPRCGVGPLFRGFFKERQRCEHCGLVFDWYSGEVIGFLYFSAAGITGLFVIAMLLWTPANIWVGRAVIVTAALAAYLLTTPFRKAIALGLKLVIDQRTSSGP
jgi:uncharacterized protein (DUF983 family)